MFNAFLFDKKSKEKKQVEEEQNKYIAETEEIKSKINIIKNGQILIIIKQNHVINGFFVTFFSIYYQKKRIRNQRAIIRKKLKALWLI